MSKVSIIIPTFSRPDNLLRAIDSALKQTYKEIEIIVVDDNGIGTQFQKETEARIKPLLSAEKIKYIKHKTNQNGSAARNSGLRECTGDYFTFLDDDDYLYPQKIEKQIQALHNNKNCDIVYCGYEKRGAKNVLISQCHPYKVGNLQFSLLAKEWGFGSGSNPLFTRQVYERTGFFDESYIRHQDLEYMVRAFRHFNICVAPDILLIKYIDSKSVRPDIEKYQRIKEKFLADFSEDIAKYNLDDQHKIYRNNWYEMALMSIEHNKKLGWTYLEKANGYKRLSIKQILKFAAYIILSKKYGR